MNSANRLILLLTFMLWIYFPILNSFTSLIPDSVNTENRKIKTIHDINFNSLDSLTRSTEKVLIDQLSIRNRMHRFYNQLNIFTFRSSPLSLSAFTGKSGWYFLTGEELKAYSGTSLFNTHQLQYLFDEFKRRETYLQSKKAKMYVIVVPVKQNVYYEYVPEHLIKSDEGGVGKQTALFLSKKGINAIYLLDSLIKYKSLGKLYYLTDNHWTDLGAFIAANSIIHICKKDFKTMKTLSLNEYSPLVKSSQGGNIAKIFAIQDKINELTLSPQPKKGFHSKISNIKKYKPDPIFPYPAEYEIRHQNNNDSLPSLFIIRDSFGAALIPYLSEQTSRSTAIYDNWTYGLNKEMIANEQPDIVLYLILESNIKNIIPDSLKTK